MIELENRIILSELSGREEFIGLELPRLPT